jgi:hypothetical protein
VLDGIAGKNYDIRLLLIDIRHSAPQAVTPQLSCGVI